MADGGLVQNILIFQEISKHPANRIAQVLMGESEAVQAAIIARFSKIKATDIIQQFPLQETKGILGRMAEGVQVPGDILQEVLQSILQKLEEIDAPGGQSMGGADKMAEILKQVQAKTGQNLLDTLAARDPKLASKIKDQMFVIADIPKLENSGLAKTLQQYDNRELALALKGVEAPIAGKILQNLSARRRALVKEETTDLGPVKRSVVDEAQTEFLRFLRRQLDAGALSLEDDDSGDEWV